MQERSALSAYKRLAFTTILNVNITAPTKMTLQEIANSRQVTVSDIVREALIQYLSENEDYSFIYRLKEREHDQKRKLKEN